MILKISDRFKNRQVSYFTDVSIDLKYDSFAGTFQLSYLFDPEIVDIKEFSCVSHYHICTLIDEGVTILTGFILSIDFEDSPMPTLARISGYSLPGVLEDCDIPPSIPEKFTRKLVNKPLPYSLQFYQLSLREIVENLIAPFGLKSVIRSSVAADMEVKYEETEAKETQSIKSFLTELASQKNIIITTNQFGNLVFQRPSAIQKPVFDFVRGAIGVRKWKLSFNGQPLHSQITVMKQSNIDESAQAEQFTIYNPLVTTVFRPKVHKITQKSRVDKDVEQSARNLRAKELRALSLTLELDRWSMNDHVFLPGDVITAINPKVYLYKKTNWFIESVLMNENPEMKTSIIKCCLPEAITGEDPKNPFAGINIHPIE